MGSEWKAIPIGECAEVYSGFAFKSNDLGNEGVPVVKIKNVNNKIVDFSETQFFPDHLVTPRHDKYFLEDGDVLIAMTGQGSVGRVGRIKLRNDQRVLLNQRVGRFITKDNLNIRYLFYVISSDYYEDILFNAGLGSGQPNLSPDVIKQIEIPLPPLPEQKAIAHILGSLDDKIELNRRMNATLESMAQVLFKSWFVDFDPVLDNALVAGNPIPEEFSERAETRRKALADGTANRETAKQFPASFQLTEELGWIPEGWEVESLDKIADYKNGLALQKFRPKPGENPLPIVKIAQLKSGEATWDELASPSIASECIINDGDVVFSWSGSLMIDLWCGGKAALNQHLFKVTSFDFPKWFYLSWSNEHLLNFQKIAADKAVTMGHIKRSHLSEAKCVIPDDKLLTRSSVIINPYIENSISLRLQNRTLIKLRDTLLPKLISGELRIPEAEKLAKEALT